MRAGAVAGPVGEIQLGRDQRRSIAAFDAGRNAQVAPVGVEDVAVAVIHERAYARLFVGRQRIAIPEGLKQPRPLPTIVISGHNLKPPGPGSKKTPAGAAVFAATGA